MAKRHTREFGTHRVKVEIQDSFHFLACLAEFSCAESSANIGDCGGRVVENLLKFLLGLNDLGVHIFSMPKCRQYNFRQNLDFLAIECIFGH